MDQNSHHKTIAFKNGWRTIARCISCHDLIYSTYEGEHKTCNCKKTFVDQTNDLLRTNAMSKRFAKMIPHGEVYVWYDPINDALLMTEVGSSQFGEAGVWLFMEPTLPASFVGLDTYKQAFVDSKSLVLLDVI